MFFKLVTLITEKHIQNNTFFCSSNLTAVVAESVQLQAGQLENQDSIPGRGTDFSLFQHVQTIFGNHPASYPHKSGQGMKLHVQFNRSNRPNHYIQP